MKQNDKKQPINKEAFKMLAMEIGLNEACRRLDVPIPTGKSWARRYGRKLPRRKGGRPQRSLPASTSSSLHPIADALDATHKDMEETTKTALMQALTKAAQAVAGKDALDVSNTAQLRNICLAAARIFGRKGESEVNVAVNNQVGVVISDAKRKELQERLRRLQEQQEREEKPLPAKPAPMTLPARVQASPSPSMRALGFDLVLPE